MRSAHCKSSGVGKNLVSMSFSFALVSGGFLGGRRSSPSSHSSVSDDSESSSCKDARRTLAEGLRLRSWTILSLVNNTVPCGLDSTKSLIFINLIKSGHPTVVSRCRTQQMSHTGFIVLQSGDQLVERLRCPSRR